MRKFGKLERIYSLSEIYQHVHLDQVFLYYFEDENLSANTIVLHPSELENNTAVARLMRIPEQFIIRIPSPFTFGEDKERSAFILLENNLWLDASGLKPDHIPSDQIGFVMAYDKCDQTTALEKISFIASTMQQSNAEETKNLLLAFREDMQLWAERSFTQSLAHEVHQQLLNRLLN